MWGREECVSPTFLPHAERRRPSLIRTATQVPSSLASQPEDGALLIEPFRPWSRPAPNNRPSNRTLPAAAGRHFCDASSGTRGERPSLSAPAIAKPTMTTAQNNRQNAVNCRMRVRWRSLIPAQSSRDRRRRHLNHPRALPRRGGDVILSPPNW
jgi:hypothetical protein